MAMKFTVEFEDLEKLIGVIGIGGDGTREKITIISC